MITLPKFYETTRCSQCGYEKQWIDTNGCPEECGRGVAGTPQPRMTRKELEALLDEMMHIGILDKHPLVPWLNEESKRHGFSNWLDAYQRIGESG